MDRKINSISSRRRRRRRRRRTWHSYLVRNVIKWLQPNEPPRGKPRGYDPFDTIRLFFSNRNVEPDSAEPVAG